MSSWRCGSMLASYTRGGLVVGVRILLLNDIFLSLNSLNSVKTFRKNSIVWGIDQNPNIQCCSESPVGFEIFEMRFCFWDVLVLLKFYRAPDIVEFVLGKFSHFNIAIAYSNSKFCGARTPSFCEFT